MNRLFGLIGYPLGHSFSKKFFSDKFEKEGIDDCRYELYAIPTIQLLPQLIEQNPKLEGLNVTIPFKEQVIPYLDWLHPLAAAAGAVNCLRIRQNRLEGYNTDIIGFESALRKVLHEAVPEIHMPLLRAMILGSGGACKAVAVVLEKLGIPYLIASRKKQAGTNYIEYQDISPEMLETHRLIINTTPLGMYPNLESAPPLPYSSLSRLNILFDLVYNPEKTVFLMKGEKAGAYIQNGLEMLYLQAEKSWEIWNEKA